MEADKKDTSNGAVRNGPRENSKGLRNDRHRWIASLEYILEHILKNEESQQAIFLLEELLERLRESGLKIPYAVNTPYISTIPAEKQPPYPGNREIERRIKSYVRWNAMAMVVKANRLHPDIGGHISTYASSATLYEVGFNHFFRGGDDNRLADMVYFQGHASPGSYSRAYIEWRINAPRLHHFRQELSPAGGLPSYPHPYLMPDFWQFPSVSMGLAPIMSIYQARFLRYQQSRGLLSNEEPKVWCFVGDGEMDEPESSGALSLAGREKLDNLIWVVNCNLQRLDGPVRGNGKIIQELESDFRGAGWNVIKVVWGSRWDRLLADDVDGRLVRVMEECVDGEYQTFKSRDGAYVREYFFGRDPVLLDRVAHMSDDEIWLLNRGGLDQQKVYAAYHEAARHRGQPTVILAKTIKGYGMGVSGEGQMITHQAKKMTEDALLAFRDRFELPLTDEQVRAHEYYKPPDDAPEMEYLRESREKLGGSLPVRRPKAQPPSVPELVLF